MQTVPLQPVPSQLTKVVLGGQNCQIALSQKSQGLFFDLKTNDVDTVVGVIARDAVPLLSREYTGFEGNLLFIDTQGNNDPKSDELGSRYELVYLTADENDLIYV
jgi:hypothetical protein